MATVLLLGTTVVGMDADAQGLSAEAGDGDTNPRRSSSTAVPSHIDPDVPDNLSDLLLGLREVEHSNPSGITEVSFFAMQMASLDTESERLAERQKQINTRIDDLKAKLEALDAAKTDADVARLKEELEALDAGADKSPLMAELEESQARLSNIQATTDSLEGLQLELAENKTAIDAIPGSRAALTHVELGLTLATVTAPSSVLVSDAAVTAPSIVLGGTRAEDAAASAVLPSNAPVLNGNAVVDTEGGAEGSDNEDGAEDSDNEYGAEGDEEIFVLEK